MSSQSAGQCGPWKRGKKFPSLGEGNGNPLQYSCLENPIDGGVRLATVHGVAKSRTWLSHFTSLHFISLGKKAGRHPRGKALKENQHKVGAEKDTRSIRKAWWHLSRASILLASFTPPPAHVQKANTWNSKPMRGQALGAGDRQGGLACCGPRGRKESDMTERRNSTELRSQNASWSKINEEIHDLILQHCNDDAKTELWPPELYLWKIEKENQETPYVSLTSALIKAAMIHISFSWVLNTLDKCPFNIIHWMIFKHKVSPSSLF